MRKCVVPVASLALVLFVGTGVMAQSPAEDKARDQYKLGFELFEAGKFEQAAVALRRAYELKPSYKILYNLAQAENNADHFAAALWAYTMYLAEGGAEVPANRLTEVKGEIKRLNGLVGVVVIQGGPDGAEVLLDKESKGRTPLSGPLFVDLGRHEIVVEYGDKRLFDRAVTLAGGERVVLNVGAKAAPVPAPAPAAHSAPVEKGEQLPEPEPVEVDEGEESGRKRLWTWVAAGVGGAALIGAVVTGSMAASRADDVKSRCDGNDCPPSVESDLDSTRALGNAATALTVVAGVGIAAAVVLFFVEPGLGKETPDTTVGLAPLPGGVAVSVGGRF